jgi:hypothetical protein
MATGELVSVILSTADRPTPAEATVGSAVGQSHGDVEVVVVDDGRNTQRVAAPTDPRVRVRRTGGGRGAAGATAMGLDTATGAWGLLLAEGDVLARDGVAELLAVARAHGGAVVSPVRLPGEGRTDAEARHRPPATLAAGGRWLLDGVSPMPGPDPWRRCAVLAPIEELRAVGIDPDAGPAWMVDLLVRLHPGCPITVTAPLLRRSGGTAEDEAIARAETVLATYLLHRPTPAGARRAAEDLEVAGAALARVGRRGDAIRCARVLARLAPRGAGWRWRAVRLVGRALRRTR